MKDFLEVFEKEGFIDKVVQILLQECIKFK
jgi:hypothetical protein